MIDDGAGRAAASGRRCFQCTILPLRRDSPRREPPPDLKAERYFEAEHAAVFFDADDNSIGSPFPEVSYQRRHGVLGFHRLTAVFRQQELIPCAGEPSAATHLLEQARTGHYASSASAEVVASAAKDAMMRSSQQRPLLLPCVSVLVGCISTRPNGKRCAILTSGPRRFTMRQVWPVAQSRVWTHALPKSDMTKAHQQVTRARAPRSSASVRGRSCGQTTRTRTMPRPPSGECEDLGGLRRGPPADGRRGHRHSGESVVPPMNPRHTQGAETIIFPSCGRWESEGGGTRRRALWWGSITTPQCEGEKEINCCAR